MKLLNFVCFINENEKRDAKRLKYSIKPEGKIVSKQELDNYEIPLKIKEMMMDWPIIYKSPYSNSFYSSTDISWSHKPDGSYRVADHWNFVTSKGPKKHCITDIKVANNTHISIGKFNKEKKMYEIILSEETDSHIKKVKNHQVKLKYLQDPETIYKKKIFKDRVLNKEILIDVTCKGRTYNGIVKKWTGRELKIENELGEIIYSNNYVEPNDISSMSLKDINGNEITDPFITSFK